jgi:23S rRNA pseudouridine2457 synthase
MTAAVGHPTLRLVRVKIGNWTLEGIEPGKYKVEAINLPANATGARPNRPGNTRPAGNRPVNNQLGNNRSGNSEQKTAGQKPNNKPRPKTAASKKPTNEKPAEKKATVIIQKPKPRSL